MKIIKTVPVLAMVFFTLSVGSSFVHASETFTCFAFSTSSPEPGTRIKLTIRIEEYTTDEEVKGFMDVLNNGDQDQLKRALEKADKGSIHPRGDVRQRFSFARSRPIQGGRLITIITSRDFRIQEFGTSTRHSREFRYTFVYLKLDEKDEGGGYMFPGTDVQFDANGNLVLQQIGADAVSLQRVKQTK